MRSCFTETAVASKVGGVSEERRCGVFVSEGFLFEVFRAVVLAGGSSGGADMAPTWLILRGMAEYGVFINFVLMLFNLIPIPPLDGSHVFAYLLPTRIAVRYRQIGMGGIMIVMIMLWLTGFRFLMVPLNWFYGAAMAFKGIFV